MMTQQIAAIFHAHAYLDEPHALDTMFGQIPGSESIRSTFESGMKACGGYAYDKARHVGYFFITDGEILSMYTVTDITHEQAGKIDAECNLIASDIPDPLGLGLTNMDWCVAESDRFTEIVNRALGGKRLELTTH